MREISTERALSRSDSWTEPPVGSFCHHALLYEGEDELIGAAEQFVRDGLTDEDRVLVVLSASKLEGMRRALGGDAASVQLADMGEVGGNPARLIPLWRTFVDSLSPGQCGRGIGEPVSVHRGAAELAECQVHEELLNFAFGDGPPFWLLCPYDVSSLDEMALDEARRSHPYTTSGSAPAKLSEPYRKASELGSLMRRDLSPAPEDAERFVVTAESVASLRQVLRNRAIAFGLGQSASDDLALAAHEVVANSLRYGGGRGDVSIWLDDGNLICEVRDQGLFDTPMAGRIMPAERGMSGRGLWMANQLCELVQIRSVPDGTVVRLHKRRVTD